MKNRSAAEDTFIEKFGLYFEQYTLYPRIAGRIFGYLLICDPQHQTAKQLAQRLKIANSSVSSMMRLLLQSRLVEQVSIPGERPRYYKIREGGWEDMFLRRLHGLSAVRQLLSEGLELMKDTDPALRARLHELDNLYAFFETELPSLSQRWKRHRQKESGE